MLASPTKTHPMKFKLPASVQVKVPNGGTIEVSAAEVVEHVVRTGRLLGASPEIEGVRTGARILAALASLEIAEADLGILKTQLAASPRGWMVVTVEMKVEQPPPAPARVVRRQLVPSSIDLLPIVEALLAL